MVTQALAWLVAAPRSRETLSKAGSRSFARTSQAQVSTNSRSTAIESVVNVVRQDGTAADTGHLQNGVGRAAAPLRRVGGALQRGANELRHADLGPEGILPKPIVHLVGEENRGPPHGSIITYIWRLRNGADYFCRSKVEMSYSPAK